jgi:hypothetical protein
MIDFLVILLKTVPKRRADGGREAPIETALVSLNHHWNGGGRRFACSPFVRLTPPWWQRAASAKVRSALGNTGAAGMGRIFFVGIVMATLACAAAAQARTPLSSWRGGRAAHRRRHRLRVSRPAHHRGRCVQGMEGGVDTETGRAGLGHDGHVVCWKESNGQLLTATAARVTPEVVSMDLIR